MKDVRDGENNLHDRAVSPDRAGRFAVGADASAQANRAWWDAEANAYLDEHGAFLGDSEFVWGPEGWHERDLNILGPLRGLRILEVGAGAAQAGRWCRAQGAQVISSDISFGMLRAGARINERTGVRPALIQCDASQLPFADDTFDVVFSAFGAVPFIADTAALMREFTRVLRPGGRVAFSTSHPIRWAFPDVPGEAGLSVTQSYFDTTPYAEARGPQITYAEHHRTLAQRVRELLDAGLDLTDLREPQWNPCNSQTWGGWSPLRGELIPGSLILVGRKPGVDT